MANLTSQQASDLSTNLLDINDALEDFRFSNKNDLTDIQKRDLDNLMEQIAESGQKMLALSVTLILDDVELSLEQIKKTTNNIKVTLKTLANIQKGINIATCTVTLAEAIICKDPKKIEEAISGLAKASTA